MKYVFSIFKSFSIKFYEFPFYSSAVLFYPTRINWIHITYFSILFNSIHPFSYFILLLLFYHMSPFDHSLLFCSITLCSILFCFIIFNESVLFYSMNHFSTLLLFCCYSILFQKQAGLCVWRRRMLGRRFGVAARLEKVSCSFAMFLPCHMFPVNYISLLVF